MDTIRPSRSERNRYYDPDTPIKSRHAAQRYVGILGTLALVLAAVGMYGVLAYHVTARTREIGLRVALGARPSDVFGLVIGQGLRVTLAGVGIGLLLSAMASRPIASLLEGRSPTDAVTWSAAVALWLGMSLPACWLPARRAARVQPVVALRRDQFGASL